jgi:hypothetical protein
MGHRGVAGGAAVIASVVIATGLAAAPSAAQSETQGTFDCEASAFRGSILGQAPVEPVVANRGAGVCKNATAGGELPLPATQPLYAAVVSAQTTANGPEGQVVNTLYGAKGGLADVRIRALPGMPGMPALPLDQLPASLTTITIPLPGGSSGGSSTGGLPGLPSLPGAPSLPLPGAGSGGSGLPSSITLDLRAALQAALAQQMPAVDLLSAEILEAQATARCNGKQPELAGSSRVAGVRLMGQELPVNAPVEQTLKLIDTTSISPASLDLSLVQLPGGGSLASSPLGTTLLPAVQTALAALPPIAIPETVARVKVTPGVQTRTATSLTQQALRVEVAIAGQSIVDLTVGEAIVRVTGDPCALPAKAAQNVAEAQLQCTRRRLVLIDVLERDGRVRLVGAADRRLVGRTVDIRFSDGTRVARTKVGKNGAFRTTAPLPPRSVRYTNDARYMAVAGREKSLNLKLHRRLVVQRVGSRNGKVTIAGRVVLPLGKPVQSVTIKRRITCKKEQVVKRFKPRQDGTFRVTLNAPKDIGVAVYRFQTKVRKNTTNPKMYPTFTLPRAVELQR